MPTIETARLLLRKIEVADAPFFYELFNSPLWLRYIGDRNLKTVAATEKQIREKYLPSYEQNGFGAFLVSEKKSGLPIGSCGIYKRENLAHPDLGFAFLGKYVGIGYGYEASVAVLEDFNNRFDFLRLAAFTVKENTASIALLHKLGFHLTGNYTFPGDSESLLLFSFDG